MEVHREALLLEERLLLLGDFAAALLDVVGLLLPQDDVGHHLHDDDTGASASVLPSYGFNLFDLKLPVAGQVRKVLFADDAFLALSMVMANPGYIDGREGIWLTQPDKMATDWLPWWKAGLSRGLFHMPALAGCGSSCALRVVPTDWKWATGLTTDESQNARLKRLLADAELDKAILKEAASGNF